MAGTVTKSDTWGRGQNVKKATLNYVCDAADGSAPDAATSPLDGWIERVSFMPGTPAPDGAFNITLYDADGVNISGTNLHALNGANSSGWEPSVPIYVMGAVTAKLAAQGTNSAQFAIHIYVSK